jgi:hypothetical protein
MLIPLLFLRIPLMLVSYSSILVQNNIKSLFSCSFLDELKFICSRDRKI